MTYYSELYERDNYREAIRVLLPAKYKSLLDYD